MPDLIEIISAEGPTLSASVHGAKACGLQSLMRAGFRVPPAFVVTVDAAIKIAAGGSVELLEEQVRLLTSGIQGPRLAVRSGAEVSLPGAFETLLDVHPDVVSHALSTVVSSSKSLRALAIAGALGHESVPPTAVIVQLQVDATADERSGAGAATSCDPVTGASGARGSFAWQTRGDAVMAGTVPVESLDGLRRCSSEAFDLLTADLQLLEDHFGGPVEVEFTVESGVIWYLQIRRLAEIAMHEPADLPNGFHGIGTGRPASPGVAVGELLTDIDAALDAIDSGRSIVLALNTTSPSEVGAMTGSAAVITAIGSPECHAAVIARSAGVPAVVSVRNMVIAADHVMIGELRFDIGDMLAVDGTTGTIAATTVTS